MAEAANEEQTGSSGEQRQTDFRFASMGAAILANRFYVTLSQAGTRIAFCESLPGVEEQFRTAVVLSFNDALELASLLNSLISANVVFSGDETPEVKSE